MARRTIHRSKGPDGAITWLAREKGKVIGRASSPDELEAQVNVRDVALGLVSSDLEVPSPPAPTPGRRAKRVEEDQEDQEDQDD